MDILLLLIDLTVYIEKKKKIERVRELNTKKYSVNIFFCRRRRCWLEFNFDFPEIFFFCCCCCPQFVPLFVYFLVISFCYLRGGGVGGGEKH